MRTGFVAARMECNAPKAMTRQIRGKVQEILSFTQDTELVFIEYGSIKVTTFTACAMRIGFVGGRFTWRGVRYQVQQNITWPLDHPSIILEVSGALIEKSGQDEVRAGQLPVVRCQLHVVSALHRTIDSEPKPIGYTCN